MVQKPGLGPKQTVDTSATTSTATEPTAEKKIGQDGGLSPHAGKTVGDPQGRTGSSDQQAQTALISLSMSLSGLAKTLEGGNKAKIEKRVGDLLAESKSAALSIDVLPKKKQATAKQQIQTFLDTAQQHPATGAALDPLGQLIQFAQQAIGVEAPKTGGASFGIGALRPDLPINFQDLTAQSGNTGTAPGGHFLNEATAERYYVKVAHKGEDMTRNELLMAKLYELVGVEVPHLNPIQITGKLKHKEFDNEFGLASVILEGDIDIENKSRLTSGEKIPGLYEGFAADAWLANWDVAGLTYDNIAIVKQDGEERAVRLDVGGAGPYRAMGSEKPGFNGEVSEMVTLRDTGRAAQAGHIFDKMSDAEVEASVARVVRVSDADVRKVVQQYGPKDKATRDKLADTLVDRKNYLAKKFPKAVEIAASLD